MSAPIHTDYQSSKHISAVVRSIVDMLHPRTVYLYNQRVSARGTTTSFKLCVVADCGDKAQAEQRVYLGIDSDVPFDVLLYTTAEWERLLAVDTSFAGRIARTGMVVYG